MAKARFQVDSIERSTATSFPHKLADGSPDYQRAETQETRTIGLSPVAPGEDANHPNAKLWGNGPSGSIQLNNISPELAKDFDIGKQFDVFLKPVA